MLIRNISKLVQISAGPCPLKRGKALADLPHLDNAYLLIKGDKIVDFGSMDDVPPDRDRAENVVDAKGGMVLPAWVDSHTHIVFAQSRELEFVDRIKGLSYQEIAAKGGGILNSARKLRELSEEALLESAWNRLQHLMQMGTGAIEIKSGYGLSEEGELKMLRVIKQLKALAPIPVKATFLGAHALPQAYKDNRAAYIELITETLIPQIAEEGLADYVDAFCEKGFFSPSETGKILEVGAKYGLKPKVHTNQFTSMGGIEVSVQHNALSVDHLEVMNDEEIQVLSQSNTIASLLPTAPFFLNDPYPPARKMIEAGLPIALASDYNPGSSPSGNMSLVVALACIKLRMFPEEAINAATINGAHAIEVADQVGSIGIGKKANLILTRPIPSLAYLPYSFGENLIQQVFINGKAV